MEIRRSFAIAVAAGVLGSLLGATPALAQNDAPDEPGGAVAPPETGVPGPLIGYATRPALARETKACSTRVPVCVHAPGTAAGQAVLDVLAASERAWETIGGALRLPTPDVDLDDLRYHVYLVAGAGAGAGDGGVTHVSARDVRSRIDRARAFTVLDADVHAGCTLDALVAREIARASLFRLSPATAEGVARAQTTYLSHLIVPCAIGLAAPAVRAFQSRPDRAVCDARAGEEGSSSEAPAKGGPLSRAFSEGASAFWWRIDWAFGRTPFALVMASWALSPTMTELGASRWHDEPDAFDVLRLSFKNALSSGSTIDDLLLDTAVARAFMGAADDGLHHVETSTYGDAARVTLDWDLPWPAKPKRIAARAPVFPTGSSYVVIKHEGAAPGARLRVEIAWEEHALFRWTLVKLDAHGRELGRVGIAARERATEAQMTLVDLDGVDRIMLVGTNVGDPAYRFDPDDEVWEPHGWLVTLASE